MSENGIAAQIADAMRNDPKVSAALTEWLDERYPIEMSDSVTSDGLRDALSLVLAEARERADGQDARLDRIEALMAQIVADRQASAREHSEWMARDIERSAGFHKRMDDIDKRQETFINEMENAAVRHKDLMARIHWRISLNESNYAEFRRKLDHFGIRTLKIYRDQQMLDAQIERLRDTDSHRRLSREALVILTRDFHCKWSEVVWMFQDDFVLPRDGSYGAYGDKLRAAFMNDEISSHEFMEIWQTGFIAKGTLESDGSEAWFVGETFSSRGRNAIFAVRDRAAMVSRFENAVAHPFVYCFHISTADREIANRCGVRVIKEKGMK